MTRRPKRGAPPLCVLFTGLLAGSLLHATTAAYAHADPTRPRAAEPANGGLIQQTGSAKLETDSALSDVAALAPANVWAVGQEQVWEAWENRGVVTHWDGSTWTEVGIRNDAAGAGHLRSIAAASATELWAVGDGHDGVPYVAKGDGSGFDRVSVPQLRPGDWLGGVAAVPGRAVTVGSRGRNVLIAAVSGGRWTVTQVKIKGTLKGVALAPGKGTTGWAVGDRETQPLIMRLSGGTWKSVGLPSMPGGFLRDVYLDGPKRAVAVGGVYRGADDIDPLILTWNGKRWRRADVPGQVAELYGVTGDGRGHYWVSGFDSGHPAQAYLLRGDGSTWKVVRGEPSRPPGTIRLQAITHVGAETIAVGHVVGSGDRYTDIVERFEPAGSS